MTTLERRMEALEQEVDVLRQRLGRARRIGTTLGIVVLVVGAWAAVEQFWLLPQRFAALPVVEALDTRLRTTEQTYKTAEEKAKHLEEQVEQLNALTSGLRTGVISLEEVRVKRLLVAGNDTGPTVTLLPNRLTFEKDKAIRAELLVQTDRDIVSFRLAHARAGGPRGVTLTADAQGGSYIYFGGRDAPMLQNGPPNYYAIGVNTKGEKAVNEPQAPPPQPTKTPGQSQPQPQPQVQPPTKSKS